MVRTKRWVATLLAVSRSYAGAVHAFSNPGADKIAKATGLPIAYHAAADRRSWSHMKAFFQEIFKGQK